MSCLRAFVIACLTLALAATGVEGATDYFVSPTGLSSNDGGTTNTPKDFQSAANLAQPNSIIRLLSGIYQTNGVNFSVTNQGTLGNPIIFRSEVKWGAVIANSTNRGIDAQDSRFVVFDGIVFSNNFNDGMKIRDNSSVSNCWFILNGRVAGSFGCGLTANGANSGSNIFDSNLIELNGESTLTHGLYIAGTDVIVRNNVIVSNAAYGLHFYTGGSDPYNHRAQIYGNCTYGHINRWGALMQGIWGGTTNGTNFIYNNTFADGLRLQYGVTYVTNNIIYPGAASVGGEPITVAGQTPAYVLSDYNFSSASFALDASVTNGPHDIINGPAITTLLPGVASYRFWLPTDSRARNRAKPQNISPIKFHGQITPPLDPKIDIGAIDWNAKLAADTRDLVANRSAIWTPLWDTLVPPARLLSWGNSTVGVPGGMATLSAARTQFCSVTASIPGTNIVAVADGVTDDSPALQAALNRCPTNAYVYLPAGRYWCGSALTLDGNNRTMRGAGSTTILEPGFTNLSGVFISLGVFNQQGTSRTNVVDIPVGATNTSWDTVNNMGSLFPGVDGSVKFWVNDAGTNQGFAAIPNGDGSADPVHYWGGGATKLQAPAPLIRFIARITGTNTGNQVYFWPPSPYYFPSNSTLSQYLYQTECKFSGIEDLAIELKGRVNEGIKMSQGMGTWIKGVTSTRAVKSHITIQYSALCEVTECVLDGAESYVANQGIGILLDSHVSAFNLYDNTMRSNFPAIEPYLGCAGGVIAYNYFISPQGGLAPIDNHNGHNFHILCEGNVGYGYIQDGNGGSGEKWTLARNWFHGDQSTFGARKVINLSRGARDFNLVGNVLGNPRTNWGTYLQLSGWNNSNTVIRRYGYPSMGNDTFTGTNLTIQATNADYMDFYVWSNRLEHANIEYGSIGTWTTNYDSTVTNRVYPYSYYTNWNVATAPSWWTNAGRTNAVWPPIGPDVVGHTNVIPAMMRFENLGLIAGGGGGGGTNPPIDTNYVSYPVYLFFTPARVAPAATTSSLLRFSEKPASQDVIDDGIPR